MLGKSRVVAETLEVREVHDVVSVGFEITIHTQRSGLQLRVGDADESGREELEGDVLCLVPIDPVAEGTIEGRSVSGIEDGDVVAATHEELGNTVVCRTDTGVDEKTLKAGHDKAN